ncbi:MAG: class I poly(R)-hydroxyalkanoic acid synthase, partial [Pseudomonadota bacterium]
MSDAANQEKGFGSADPEAFVHNLAKLYEEYGKAVAAYLEPREKGIAPAHSPAETNEVITTLTKVAESWLSDPQRAVALQSQLWKNYIGVWGDAFRRMMGDASGELEPKTDDKRFQSPDWSRNIFFDFCKQLYLTTTDWAAKAVEQSEGLDPHTREKARFYVQQISAALSPSNFLLTNPELLQETFSSNAENLVRGMHMMAEDIRNGKGDLKLRQTDADHFALGRNIAMTRGSVVFQNDIIQLLQYEPTTEKVFTRPLLIVPPWINKFYILDLNEEKSLIKWLVDQGHTVFCISWVNPDASLRDKGFDDYMQDGILASLRAIEKITEEPVVNAVGYCVGGTLLAATQAWLATEKKQHIASLSFLTAQVDFELAGNLKLFMDEKQIETLEEAMNARGFLDSSYMASAFNMLRAMSG